MVLGCIELAKRDTVVTLSLYIYLLCNTKVLLQLNVLISAWASQCDDSNHHKNDINYVKYLKNGFTAH